PSKSCWSAIRRGFMVLHDRCPQEAPPREVTMTGREVGLTSLTLAAAGLLCLPASAQVQKVGDLPEAKDMRLVGYSDLQARSAYQPLIHRQGDRWIAYIGHHG